MKTYKSVLFLLLILFSENGFAAFIYTGGSYSFAGVVSDDDFYKGASGEAIGLHFGIDTGRVATEVFIKKYELENDNTVDGVTFNLKIPTTVMGFGFRLELIPSVDLLMGINSQKVQTNYTASDSTKTLSALKNATYVNWYLGGGIRGELTPDFSWRLDSVYYSGDKDFSHFTIEIGLMYKVLIY